MPKDKKQAVAKTLLDLNYSATEIAEILGIHRTTVYRYAEKPLNDDLLQFSTEIQTLFTMKQYQLMAKILKNIEEIVDKTDDLRAMIVTYQVLKQHTPTLYQIKSDEEHRKKWSGLGLG